MENASKALIMAAEVLIGVMIISIAVYLFSAFGSFSRRTNERFVAAQLNQFNNQFLKYTGVKTNASGISEQVTVSIYDIANLANLARKHNEESGLVQTNYDVEGTTTYIRIDVGNKTYIEQYGENQIIDLLKENALDDTQENIKQYVCLETNYHISSLTGRVNYMKFTEL